MTLKQIESELRRVNAAIQDLYWTFTRTKRGKPPAMVAPHLYTRRSELEAERSRILRAKLARVHTFATPVHEPRGSTWQTCTGCGVVRGTERTRFCRRLVVGPNAHRCNGGRA